MTGVESPLAPSAVGLLGDVSLARWEQVGSTSATGPELEARMDEAWKLIAGVLSGRETNATVQRLRATILALDGQHEQALAALAQAQGDTLAPVIASAVHVARRDWVAAEREARRAVELRPNDADALGALARCLWLSGRVEEARKGLDEAPAFSLTGTQAADLYAVIEREVPGDGPRGPALPHLAARVLDRARRAQDRVEAERWYRRSPLSQRPSLAPPRGRDMARLASFSEAWAASRSASFRSWWRRARWPW
ncbi:MAG: tetratricopeptide repeat protein [Archangium sp.]|nr:tetratricopeptide repeat protein [Archangium sp.]